MVSEPGFCSSSANIEGGLAGCVPFWVCFGCALTLPDSPCGCAGTLKRPFFKRHPDGSFFFESGKAAQQQLAPCGATFLRNRTSVAIIFGSGQR
jgi:hypothetical protein